MAQEEEPIPMPMIVFERTAFTLDAPTGGRVVDLCDLDIRTGVPFACRHANCGSCRVEVIEGASLCAPPEDDELSLLDKLGSQPRMRLACQLTILEGRGVVRLRVTF